MKKISFKLQPDFQRVKKALSHQIPDRIPMVELAVDKPIKEQFLGRPIKTVSDEIDFWYRAGYDYAWIRVAYDIDNLFPGAYDSGTGHATAPIKTLEDFKKYPWPEIDKIDFSILDEAAKHLPQGMKMISGEGGFFSFSWMLMGMDNFCIQCAEGLELAASVVKKVCETLIAVNQKAINHPEVGAVWVGDDIAFGTSLFMSPQWLKKNIFPYYEQLGNMCKEAGKPFIFHSDGDIRPIINSLIDAGFDAIHPIEPQAMNIEEIKALYGNKLTLIGNIDIGSTLPFGTKEQIREEVMQRIKTVGKNGGYCVSSSNTITKNIPLHNYIEMIEAVYQYGKYPINL
jgi:uroporphyrinogen decarboxylase